ncbi:expansin [Marchantia polymorpha subsp. ruderalis]|uniref:Expansin n=2 Tax=Marchantia polymorpha TaxID=3197 RepID=A0A176WQQ8_MARPO|nr:hypothetical protein AXG93_2189s1020 [Marchantia polymorpha subsp. ruderalis]PTQ33840.1 hypothetical protein MARPO_0085s0053 [Marchantia polymorpha]PTQ33841.1 hypothetical protein MARPO_0085s0053 [Marchantia polymorpha]BBN05034.1 hypothetical protein Mp_3g09750 [Marchantia polymorpha subsp. ruderalis]BBN05035.1 hypothetical protein Mp_3g09750 [Marchantia polymorpha subsp. ruderalis]|eukprot:PTQ33840.1 hypothetical protein MARPO_0085s0053 [Marchantia polymorpha]
MVRLPDNMLTFGIGIGIVCTLSTVMRVECIPELISSEPPYAARTWMDAHATFHGGSAVADTMGGACGYGNLISRGYGLHTSALSSSLFNSGLTCGACFKVRCKAASSMRCHATAGSITVTATDLYSENLATLIEDERRSNPSQPQFDLAVSAFQMLARPMVGLIPIEYQRVPCEKEGGIRFTLNGNSWFNLVLVHNVGGDGNVVAVQVKGSRASSWSMMNRRWGQNWELRENLQGQILSFRITTGFGKTVLLPDVAQADWRFGQTYESEGNFSGW